MTETVGAGEAAKRRSFKRRLAGVEARGLTLWPPQQALASLLGRKLARDVGFLQVSNTLQKGYGFLFSVACVRLLHAAGYGDYLLILSLYQTVNLVGSLGLGQFLVVPLARAAAAGDRDEVARAAGYILKLSAVIASLVVVACLAGGPLFGDMVRRPDLGGLMRIVALGSIPAIAYNVSTTALQSVRRMRDLAIVENVDTILGRALGLAAIAAGWGLPGLLWATTAGAVLSAIHAMYQYHRVAVRRFAFPTWRSLAATAWRVPFRAYFRFSAVAIVDKNVAQLFGQTPMLFLGRWWSSEQVAYFGIAAKVFTLLAAFHGAVSKALAVRLSQELGRNGAAATRRLFWQATLIWGSVSTLAAGGFIFLLPVFRRIYGPENLPSLLLVVLLAVLTAKQGFTVALGPIFLIMNRVATNALAKIPLIIVFLPIGALMVQRWGAVGAAAYQLAAFAAGDAVYFTILTIPWFWRGVGPADAPKPEVALVG